MITPVTFEAGAASSLRPALRACPDAFDELMDAVRAGRVSIYHIHGDGYDMKIAGELDGDTYYLWAAAGRGIRLAWRELRDAMKLSGLNEMNADTKFKAVARIARSLGGEISAKPDGWEYISLKVV